ncbi:MAG: serine/threonine protein kinase [Deltaproteobacteria bacterium]|nr:serine/threonine protein kinase [Deltaproteobacteria bacterium]
MGARPGDRGEFDALLRGAGLEDRPLTAEAATQSFKADSPTGPFPLGPLADDKLPQLPKISVYTPERALGDRPSGIAARSELLIRGVLGEGGSGRVLLASQRSLSREVAVKVLYPNATHRAKRRLLNDALVAGALEHPNILPVHALGQDADGRPVLVLRRVHGVNWEHLLRERDHPDWSRLEMLPKERLLAHLEILLQVCNAVHFAHSREIVHRDLKPDNVLVGNYGEVYLIDWGLACKLPVEPATLSPRPEGAPAYMAPEMVHPSLGPIGPHTDVYLLGATLHHILVGVPPHAGRDLYDVLWSAVLSEPRSFPPSVPEALARLCAAALSQDPAQRPPTVMAFRQGITRYLEDRKAIELAARLSTESWERLRALTPDGALPPQDVLTTEAVGRALDRCRSGFEQAMSVWPDGEDARRGLAQALHWSVERALHLRNTVDARALLSALTAPEASLRARVEALEATVQKERRLLAAASSAAREADPRPTASARAVLAAGLLAGVLGAVGLVWESAPQDRSGVRLRTLLEFDALLVALTLTLVFALRRRLLVNESGRRYALLTLLTFGVLGVSATTVFLRGGTGHEASVHAMVLCGACALLGAVVYHRGMSVVAVLQFTAGALAAWRPTWTVPAGTTAMVLTLIWMLGLTSLQARRPG